MAAKDGKHAWKAEGTNPKTGREVTLKGGEAKHRGKWGTKGGKSEGQVKSFFARHADFLGEFRVMCSRRHGSTLSV